MGAREVNYGSLKVVRLGGPLVSAHLLVSDDVMTLIDTGLWGIPGELRSVVRRLGRSPRDLRDIVLTHGHLDHTGGRGGNSGMERRAGVGASGGS